MKCFLCVMMGVFVFFSGELAKSSVKIETAYSESANIFDFMDNVSNWWEGFCEEEYQTYWRANYGKSEADLADFAKYQTFRRKYYKDLDQSEKDPRKNPNGLFPTPGDRISDTVAEAFYESNNMEQAFQKLEKIVSAEDLVFLVEFYKKFEPRYSEILKESLVFREVVSHITKQTSQRGLSGFFDRIAKFYGTKASLKYRVLYVWWPPIQRSNASPTGRFLIMRFNPKTQADLAKRSGDVIFHEVVHTISAEQSSEQKQAISKTFLDVCPMHDKLKRLKILEEPLAVVFGQIIYAKTFAPKTLKFDASLYNDSWISLFAKVLYPVADRYLAESKSLSNGFAEEAGGLCKEIIAVADRIGSPKLAK